MANVRVCVFCCLAVVILLVFSIENISSNDSVPNGQYIQVIDTDVGKDCTSYLDCGFGSCVLKNKTAGNCNCGERYSKSDCTYKKKSQMHAFLLSFFLGPWGVDRFYLDHVNIGVVKLIATITFIVVPFSPCCCYLCLKHSESLVIGALILACSCFSVVLTFWFSDWIRILGGSMLDGEGETMYLDM